MTQPIHAATDESGQRVYFNDNRKKFFSVTRLLSETLPKQQFLVPWAAKVVAETAAESILDFMLGFYYTDEEGSIDVADTWLYPYFDGHSMRADKGSFDAELFAKDLKDAWKWERDTAGSLGDEVHEAAEYILKTSKGKAHIAAALLDGMGLPSTSEAYRRLGHLVSFLTVHKVDVVSTEFTVFNEDLGYAGSCDFAAYVDSVPYIIDIKTSRDVHPEMALQITAYARGEYVLTHDGQRDTMPFEGLCPNSEVRGGILHLQPKKCKFIEVDITDAMYDCLSALCLVKKLWVDEGSYDALCGALFDSSHVKEVE